MELDLDERPVLLEELDLDERLLAPLDIEALRDLIEQWEWGCVEPTMSPPRCLGWDINRRWPNAEGFAIWRDLMHAYEPPLLVNELLQGDPRHAVTMEQYEAYLVETWTSYARPKHWVDQLIVDVMHADRQRGYEPCGVESVVLRTEAILDDLAAKAGAKRAAVESAEQDAREARVARHRKRLDRLYALDDAGYTKWLEDGRPFLDKLKWERWNERRFQELLESPMPTPTLPPPPLPPLPPISAEILERYKREHDQHAAASIGPLPEHPNLTVDQAGILVKHWAHLPSGKIIDESTRELWASGSFDKYAGRIKDAMKTEGAGMLASTWLSQYRFVKSMGWAPGEPMIVENKVLTSEGWHRSPGDRTFNRYVAPDIQHVAGDVSKWVNHIKKIYPNEYDHIILWCAHRVQRPGEKVNHCLDFIGPQGIGKDTIMEPVIAAIGKHNFQGIGADVFYKSDYNDFLQSVILRLDEVHDLGGESRYGFYDKTKTIITAPPTTHRINVKYVPQYSALNVCGVVLTSNHLDALYVSHDDRRHFVCVSTCTKEDFSQSYWTEIYQWFDNGGNEAVAHYLANRDLSAFNAKAPPPKTAGWHMVVDAGLAPESSDLADVIEAMGKPAALTLTMIRARTPSDSQLRLSFEDPKLRKMIPKRLNECGYIVVGNPDARESGGRWRMHGGKTTIYGRQDLSEAERLDAARRLGAPPPPPR
jgi:Family of unknown function (DUF5906)